MTASQFDDSGPGVLRDTLLLFAGRQIGAGVYRRVFEVQTDPSLVLKVEEGGGDFSNQMEEAVWRAVRDTKFRRWFAPVVAISPWGVALLMRRTEPLTDRDCRRITHLPAFFTDIKRANFGMLNGRVVCHDYGLHLLLENGMTSRMRRVKW